MSLVDKVRSFKLGWVVNLERGNYLGVFIGQLSDISEMEAEVELKITDATLYRLNGLVMDQHRDYKIAWNKKDVVPTVPLETSTKLSFYVPIVGCFLVFYHQGTNRPDLAEALEDLRRFRYI